MTDNEIIKALECCGSNGWGEKDERPCDKCPMQDCEDCEVELPDYALGLVNRQKERIEELEKSELSKAMTFNSDTIKRCSAEAIREFSKYLIDKAETNIINISDLPDLVAEFMKTEDK